MDAPSRPVEPTRSKTVLLAAPPGLPPSVPGFVLVRPIGRGGYGEVWLTRSLNGEYRAIKIVRRSTFTEPRAFARELEGLRRYEPISRVHDSQVSILQLGQDDEAGFFFYVMELADDERSGRCVDPAAYVPHTLQSELARRGRLPVAECVRVGLSLTNALVQLHGHGLVHRDIKPSNVVFIDGLPKLADLGLVTGINDTQSFVGTEGYLPPEGPGTPQADLFSLGKVLYELVTGKVRILDLSGVITWAEFFRVGQVD